MPSPVFFRKKVAGTGAPYLWPEVSASGVWTASWGYRPQLARSKCGRNRSAQRLARILCYLKTQSADSEEGVNGVNLYHCGLLGPLFEEFGACCCCPGRVHCNCNYRSLFFLENPMFVKKLFLLAW